MDESATEQSSRVKQGLAALAVTLALAGGGWAAYRRWGGPSEIVITYRTAAVDRGDLRSTVTATGTLSALVTVLVGSQVSGRLSEVLVDFGSTVKKNQVLARLDPELLQAATARDSASLTVSQGNLARSQANQTAAEMRAERARQLVEQGVGNRSDLDDASAAVALAKADVVVSRGQVAQAAAALKQSKINLSYVVITSPVDGVVISRSVDVGQTVAASLSAPTLFTIAGDLRQMQVDSSVAEADVGKIKPAMNASFTVDAYPNKPFAAVTVQNVVTYNAVLDVANPDLLLKPGMTANVKFIYAQSDQALRVPNAALRFHPPPEALASAAGSAAASGSPGQRSRPAGSGAGSGERGAGRASRGSSDASSPDKAVWVLRDGKPARVRIKVGVSDGSFTEVVEGNLTEGDSVIVDAEVPETKGAPTTRPTTASPLGGSAPAGRMGRGL